MQHDWEKVDCSLRHIGRTTLNLTSLIRSPIQWAVLRSLTWCFSQLPWGKPQLPLATAVHTYTSCRSTRGPSLTNGLRMRQFSSAGCWIELSLSPEGLISFARLTTSWPFDFLASVTSGMCKTSEGGPAAHRLNETSTFHWLVGKESSSPLLHAALWWILLATMQSRCANLYKLCKYWRLQGVSESSDLLVCLALKLHYYSEEGTSSGVSRVWPGSS